MIIELIYNDTTSDFKEISCTELTAPSVLFDRDTGKFFIKTPCDPRINKTVAKYLLYRECRGEVLNNIAIVRPANSSESEDEEVAA